MALEQEKYDLQTYVQKLAKNEHVSDVSVTFEESDKSNVFVIAENGKLAVTVTTDLLKSHPKLWESQVQKALLKAVGHGGNNHFVGRY